MNEELKPLSSGLMQADTKQVERQSFATAQDLNSFLIRRQLLTIERKRIQEFESLRRQRLENLPRTVERYIRRRAKKLFAYLKPHASTGITDRPVATRVQDPGWRLPRFGALTLGRPGLPRTILTRPRRHTFEKIGSRSRWLLAGELAIF